MTRFIFILVCSLAVFDVFAQTRLLEKITKSNASEWVIPYEKYVLPNGLTLIIHEDHSDPLVHVDVTYHVGSAREEIGKSGFAHFFEHMMFQGSDHVADEQHFKIITEAGGTLNGTTNRDRTNYFETVPSNQLEKMLWLEADRMGFLLDAVTQKKFEVQRATVKNERGQNYDNLPYGLVQETMSKNLFPYGHPYSWLTIGYVEDLNRVDVNDLKNFFLRWYGPNNATITVGGDVQPAQVVKWVEKYFGSIPKGPVVEKTILPVPKLNADRFVSMTDNYAKNPMLVCAIPSPPMYDRDEAALDCLAEIIGGDNNSILFQRLVKTQKALKANSSNQTFELAGTFQIQVLSKPGVSMSDLLSEIKSAIKEFETRGITDDDLEKFKSSFEARTIYGLESVSGKVSQLAAFQTFTGNANYLKTEVKRYQDITKADVLRVYNQYIKDKPMVVLSVLTKNADSKKAAEDNYVVSETGYKAPNYGYDKLSYIKAKDKFDRSKMPVASTNPALKIPKYKKIDVDGMSMLAATSNELPVVVLQIELKGGRLAEQNDLSKAGVSQIFAEMMGEDTKLHTAEEMTILLDKLGSSIEFSNGLDATLVIVRCLKKNLQATLDLLDERLLQPRFTQEAFDRIKNQTLESIKNNKSRAAIVANNVYSYLNYGKFSVLGTPGSGHIATVTNITLDDIKAYYKNYISRDQLQAVLVGDINDKESLDILQRFTKLSNHAVNLTVLPAAQTVVPNTIHLVNIPKAAQTEFRIGYVTGLTFDALGEYRKSILANYPFGGAFNSRVNLNLREDKGWTYGARSNFMGNQYTGSFTFSSGIRANATDSALKEVLREMDEYARQGIRADELSFMRLALGQSDALKYETLRQKAGFLGTILRYNLSADFVEKQNKQVQSIRKEEIDLLAKKWFDPSKMNIVLAGDKDKIAPGLEKLGYTIKELDTEGELK